MEGGLVGGRGDVVFGVVGGGLEDDERGVAGDDAELAAEPGQLVGVAAVLGLERRDLEGGPRLRGELAGLVVGAQIEGDGAGAGGVVEEAEVGDQGRGAAAQDAGDDQARAGQRRGHGGVELGELVGVAAQVPQALGLEGEEGRGVGGGVDQEVEVLAAAAAGEAAQAGRVGARGGDDGVDRRAAGGGAVVVVGAVVEEAVAEQQPGVDVGVGSPGGEAGGAVELGGLEGAAQGGPVAAVDREALGGLGGVAQADQEDRDGAGDRAQVTAEQVELAAAVARRAGAGGVPHDAEGARAQARAGARVERLLGPEVGVLAAALGGDGRVVAGGERQLEGAVGGEVVADDLKDMSLGPGGHAQAEGVGDHAGAAVAAADGEAQGEAVEGGEVEGEAVVGGAVPLDEGLLVGDQDPLGGFREDRVDAGAVAVALGLLEQAGVGVAAHDLLEDLAAPVLGDRDRVAQVAVDVHGEADDGLAGEQGELQLALERAVVGVLEGQLPGGDREGAGDLDGDLELGEADGAIAGLRDDVEARDDRGRRRRERQRHARR